ncbi:Rieske (2Fe-2S) protein [Ilumatobacter nonamiensis]|uniref:Rieske (2Fe-2S) protein n=1 Tax=Ilumatobacter nonamiensis TaxID=467093 RepID=UPI0003450AF9|nr:Rieske 2Fe-2S domain-containing protein [Ilumatobacter nonamiensis]
MNATDLETEPVTRLSDFPEGSMKMVKVDGQRVCLVRTASGVHALDHACPHEGYGLTQGVLDGETLTCAWHNWKFRVSDGACVLGEENVQTHGVTVDDEGGVRVTLNRPDPAEVRVRVTESLRRGIERDYVGQVSRDVVRLLRADEHPGELIWQGIAHGAPRGEFGWGHSIASATDCLSMIDLYDGDQRALPIVQGIAGIAETQRYRPVQVLPDPATDPRTITAPAFRAAVEAEALGEAQSLLRGAIHRGDTADDLRPWFTQIVSDHHLSYGHAAIYGQKAFELLDMIGWERADTVLPHLVPTIVYGTREDGLPYMRPFMKAMADVDLGSLTRVEADPGWSDDGRLEAAILGRDRVAPVAAVTTALREGAGVDGVLDVVVDAVSERMLRYDFDGEFDFDDDFGWLDITHGITYAHAIRWHHHHVDRADPSLSEDLVRLAYFSAFLGYWTGRHEWHTHVGDRHDVAPLSTDVGTYGDELQRQSQTDGTTAFIVHAHAVKTSRAAALEARRRDTALPLDAVSLFLNAPKLERFVAATVHRSIDFLAGRAPRDT